ncbi:MAG TPA: hypothetical protein ENJ62_04115 [Bryobacterales bacterium]|nr:hypothetical protein [Bryobacterales bacterium]
MEREWIRLRTQYRNITFTVLPDGTLYLNGEQVGRLFPDEYEMIRLAIEDAGQEEFTEAA